MICPHVGKYLPDRTADGVMKPRETWDTPVVTWPHEGPGQTDSLPHLSLLRKRINGLNSQGLSSFSTSSPGPTLFLVLCDKDPDHPQG